MPGKLVRSDYDQLKNIANAFRQQEDAVKQTTQKLKRIIDQLNGGQDWVGVGATAFYQEMDGEVMPAMGRLQNALSQASRTSDQVAQVYKEAEDEMSSFWKQILQSVLSSVSS